MTEYKGTSPGKLAAMATAYGNLVLMPRPDWNFFPHVWWSHKHIVIAGDNCDTTLLKLGGAPARNIISCEQNYYRLEAARREGVTIPPSPSCYDIRDIVEWSLKQGHEIASIHVDLMHPVKKGMPVLKEILDMLKDTAGRVLILFTYLKGRDYGFKSLQDRKNYMKKEIGVSGIDITHIPYQSISPGKKGSPMVVAYFNYNPSHRTK